MISFFVFPLTSFAEKVLVIDPGHGGMDSGATGDNGKVLEKNLNLEIALKIREELKNSDIKVYITREDDSYLSLQERTDIANKLVNGNNDHSIFISIHHNSVANKESREKVKGLETYYYDPVKHYKPQYPADPMQYNYVQDNARLAKLVHNSILDSVKSYYKINDRGIKDSQAFFVIRNSQMPAVLVELGYVSNSAEVKVLNTSEFQTRAAKGIAEAVKRYFKVFEVYDMSNNKLATFEKKEDAINFAKKQNKPVKIFDKDKQMYIHFHVYHRTNGYLGEFFNKEDAIKFAERHNNTRVVDRANDWTIWSDYVPANYYVYVNDSLKGKFFEYEEALAFAEKNNNSKIVRNSTGEILCSNINGMKPTKTFNVNSLAGSYRSTTSTAVSRHLYPNGFASNKDEKTVILTTGYEFADALSAGPLTRVYGKAPILLTESSKLDYYVKNEIKRLKAEKVIIIGGEQAVSRSVENELESIGVEVVERFGGDHRYQTNERILEKMKDVEGYFVVSGTSFADALSVAPIAAAKNWGIVLTEKDHIRQTVLNKIKGKPALIIGGDAVVSQNVENKVRSVANSVKRLGGSDRYRTLAQVLWHFEDDFVTNTMIVSTGKNFPDALASAPLAIDTNAPLILLDQTPMIKQEIQSFLLEFGYENNINHVLVVGGTLSDDLVTKVSNKVR